MAKKVYGFDNNEMPDNDWLLERREFTKYDLAQPLPLPDAKFDLCMSLEVAEHLDATHADTFIRSICQYSDLVLFSAAIPGQTGINHVNEQWPQYWVKKFMANGFYAYDILRLPFWNNHGVAWWYSQNMLIFARENSKYATMLNEKHERKEYIFPLVHPKCLYMYREMYEEALNTSHNMEIPSDLKAYERIHYVEQTKIPTHLTDKEKFILYALAGSAASNGKINFVELGSYLGASSICIASALTGKARLYCVDTWQNEGMREGLRDTYSEFITNIDMLSRTITPLRGKSAEVARTFNNNVDFLFIDADHNYEGIMADLNAWWPKLLPGAIVLMHDVGWAEGLKKALDDFVRPRTHSHGRLPNMFWGVVK